MSIICLICGGSGYPRKLEYCRNCGCFAVHRYCLKIKPSRGEDVVWFCEDCKPNTTSPVPLAKPSLRLKRSSLNKGVKRKELVERLNSMRKRIKHKTENDEKLEVHLELNGDSDDDDVLTPIVPQGSSLQIKKASDRAKHDGVDDSLRTKIMKARMELDWRSSIKKTTTSDAKASTADVMFPPDVPAGGSVQRQKAFDRAKNDGVGDSSRTKIMELDGGFTYKKTTASDAKASTADATPLAVPRDGYIQVQRVSDRAKLDSASGDPDKEPIWMGSFHLQDESFGTVEGLVAHPSTLASSTVRKSANTLPALLPLELLPEYYMWPKGFQKKGPTSQDIALYFFPSNERTEMIFDSLVDKMMSRHRGMKAVLQDSELLIFSSAVLPPDSWRFKSKYYLWGVFREKQPQPVSSKGRSCSGERPWRFSNLGRSNSRFSSEHQRY